MKPDHKPLLLGSPRFPADIEGADDAQRWQTLVDRHGVEQAAGQVEGDFAVALTLDDGRLFMAVDRFAVRSLCYRLDADGLRAAARADDLAAAPAASAASAAPAGIDAQALFDYLYFHVIPAPRTVFQGVQRLPAAHWAVLEGGQLRSGRYWTPRFSPRARADFGALKQEFHAILARAVERQLDGSRAACFLSGGTDSSTIAGMIGRVSGKPAVAYSIGFAADQYDEMAYARIAAKHFGCEHREYYVTPEDLVRDIPKVAAAYDQPFGNSSVLPAYHCALQARNDGVTRLLAGDGGDELFGGNSRYAMQRVFGWYHQLPAGLRKGLMEPLFGSGVFAKLPVLKRGAGYIRQANTPLPDRSQAFNLVRRLGYDEVLAPGLLAQVDPSDVDLQQRAVWAEAQGDDDINRYLAYDWRYTLAESDLPKVCGATSLAGLSVAFPLLDGELVDFSTSLPASYKLKRLKLRWFFKEALRGFLPDEILVKKKQGFGLPFGVWAVQHAGLQALAKDSLASMSQRGIVNPAMVRTLLDTHLPAHPHYYGTLVWILIMLEQWLRVHRPDFRVPG